MRRRRLEAQELCGYRAPFQTVESRRPMHVFPAEITGSGKWLAGLEAQLEGFKGPAFFIWPENDIAFQAKELARWQKLLPQAQVTRLAKCGHYLWIDARQDCIAALRAMLT